MSTSSVVMGLMLVSSVLGFVGCPDNTSAIDDLETGDEETGGDEESGDDEETGDDEEDPIVDLGATDGEVFGPDDPGEPANTCGDFAVQVGEQCDGWNTNFETCTSLGFAGGQLACHDNCTFDLSACFSQGCGNGIIEADEVCDNSPYPCWELGYAGSNDTNGMAPCQDDCTPDESACDASCLWGQPGCFCVATTPCPSGYSCTPNLLFLADAPGTCTPNLCVMQGSPCSMGAPPDSEAACCPGLTCVDLTCS